MEPPARLPAPERGEEIGNSAGERLDLDVNAPSHPPSELWQRHHGRAEEGETSIAYLDYMYPPSTRA